MRARWLLLFPIVLFCLSIYSPAQLWSGVLAPTRAIDWTTAGVAGGVPANYTQCGSTIAAYTGAAATINNALAACGPNTYVLLGAGTFTLSTGIRWSVNNVALRGSGPTQTMLVFQGGAHDGCGGVGANVCMISTSTNDIQGFGNAANWTAGYAQGTTTITISANTTGSTKPVVGTALFLDQLNDGSTRSQDTNGIFVCSTGGGQCTQSNGGNGRSGRNQQELVTVTAISAGACPCTVTISPGLYMPNWRSGQSPQAWWANGPYLTGVGLESVAVDVTQDTLASGGSVQAIAFFNVTDSWVKNIRTDRHLATAISNSGVKHIELYQSKHITIRDSYFFGRGSVDEYGVGFWDASNNLIENNIFQTIGTPMIHENGNGNVFGYNFTIDNWWGNPPGTWAQGSIYGHGSHEHYALAEGNLAYGLEFENYFGHGFFVTAFRNRFTGFQAGNLNQTVPMFIYGLNRYFNIVGNVLGTSGYHTTYQTVGGGSAANCLTSIYAIGLGDNCNNGDGSSKPLDDTLVSNTSLTTLMRWGNYDTANSANRFINAEVPSGISLYANPVPASQTLPASFYLPAKPVWWSTMPWPPIGPDVTGGNIANVGGHAYLTPAANCYLNIMGGPAVGTGGILSFDATACYGNPSPRPAPPTGLTAVVQ